jgi:hypothetical protein
VGLDRWIVAGKFDRCLTVGINFDATNDVQWEGGRSSGAADIIEGLMLEFDDLAVGMGAGSALVQPMGPLGSKGAIRLSSMSSSHRRVVVTFNAYFESKSIDRIVSATGHCTTQ